MEDDILNLDTSIGITLVFPHINDSGCMYADKRWYVNDVTGNASANPVTITSIAGIEINDATSLQLSTDNFGTCVFATNQSKYIVTGNGGGGAGEVVTTPFTPIDSTIVVGDDFQLVAEKSQGQINSLITDVTTLQNNEYKITYFAQVSASSGTITIPTGGTIMLDQFAGSVDAYVSTISGGQPTGFNPTTAGGTIVDVSSFDASGNYVLTGTPSSYPVAIIYVFKIKAENWGNVSLDNIVEYDQTGFEPTIGILPVTKGGTGTGTAFTQGSIVFAGVGGVYSQNNTNLFWDNTNNKHIITNTGSSTYAAPQAGTLIHIVSSGTNNGRLSLDTYTAANTFGAIFQGRKARGTNLLPTAALADDTLALIGGDGYGTTGFHGSSIGAFLVKAEANLTDASAPTYLAFFTTATGSTTSAERWRISQAGNLSNSGTSSANSYLLLKAGSASTAPIQLTTGTLTNGANRKSGQIQYNSGVFYGTTADATAEKPFSLQTGIFTSGSVVFVDGSGILAQDNSNFFWDDTNNRLGIGTATPIGSIELVGTASPQDFYVTRYSADALAGGIIGRKARGTSGSPTAVQSGDTLSLLGGRGYGATGFSSTNKANVSLMAAENWTDSAQGTYISFNTTAAGGTTRAEVAKLNNTALTLSAIGINEVQASDIASASTTDIGAAKGNYVVVTGTTTITSFGTIQAGTRRIVKFSGALTLTYNATSLILPSATNILTAANDTAVFVSLGSGNWVCTSYTRNAFNPTFLDATSSIQTQLDGKVYTIQGYAASVSFSPADATTYYWGGAFINSISTTSNSRRYYIPKTGILIGCIITFEQSGTSSNETSTIYTRLNDTTDITISSSVVNNAAVTTFSNFSLNQAVTQGTDYINVKWTTPTWTTNPTSVITMVTWIIRAS